MKKIFLDKLVPNSFPCMIVNNMLFVKCLCLPVTREEVTSRRNYISFIGKQSSIHQLQKAILEEGVCGFFLISKDSKEFSGLLCL